MSGRMQELYRVEAEMIKRAEELGHRGITGMTMVEIHNHFDALGVLRRKRLDLLDPNWMWNEEPPVTGHDTVWLMEHEG